MEVKSDDLIIQELKAWMGEAGIQYFRDIKIKHKRIDAIWNEGGIPHVVHFREGMQVRNKLREIIPDQGDHWYDENWIRFTQRAIQ